MEEAREFAVMSKGMSKGQLKKRDYTNFGQVAKVRFRPMCSALGFEQVKPTEYQRNRGEWVDVIQLETSQWGGNSFRIFWGIKESQNKIGMRSSLRFPLKREDGKPSFWNRYTKSDIKINAEEAYACFLVQAEPFLKELQSKEDIGWYVWDKNEKSIRKSLNDQRRMEHFCHFFIWANLTELAEKLIVGRVPALINVRKNRSRNLKFIKYQKTIM